MTTTRTWWADVSERVTRARRSGGIVVLGLAVALGAAGCPRRPPSRETVRPPRPPVPSTPSAVETAVSDVATGGSWEEGGQSGVLRVVVRGGGRRNMRSDVTLQWLRWDDRAEQPIEVRSVKVTELSRGGIIVTATRIEQDEGRPVVRLDVANAVTGVAGEARVWPQAVGRYRAKLKWVSETP
jgi:hypothetical protein